MFRDDNVGAMLGRLDAASHRSPLARDAARVIRNLAAQVSMLDEELTSAEFSIYAHAVELAHISDARTAFFDRRQQKAARR